MSGQQKFQIVSAGKVLRSKNPAEVLAQMSSSFSISAEQARKLLLKGWVIKDQLSPGQVVQYRTQLQQIGLKIEVHPAGKFDNRALVARMQFAKKRRDRQATGSATPEPAVEPKAVTPAVTEPVPRVKESPVVAEAASPKIAPGNKAREQLQALFTDAPAAREQVGNLLRKGRVRLVAGALTASLVPLLFAVLSLFCVYQAGIALWGIPAALLSGSFGPGTLIGAGLTLMLLILFAALVLLPYYRVNESDEREGLPLRKTDAPGVFLLLDVLNRNTGLPVPTALEVNAGADSFVRGGPFLPQLRGEVTLSIGLSSAASLSGGEALALATRALAFYSCRLTRVATWLLVMPARRLQAMQDAFENETTLLSANGAPGGALRLPHMLLVTAGLGLLPVVERLHTLHRRVSKGLGQSLAERADAVAASVVGGDDFSAFATRWHRLVHADLVTGEINREAQLMGKRLADYPAAVHWLYNNLDKETLASIELAMDEDSDVWNLSEPASSSRVELVEDNPCKPVLARTDFSLAKLFADFRDLSSRVSRLGADDHCRAVENHLLMSASKEVEQAQKVLAEYFNRVIPRDLLPLSLPANEDLCQLDLQQTVDWLRSRLVDLQDLEERYAKLQLQGAKIQLGAALIRSNIKPEPARYCLSGVTPAAADESRRDNRERIKECQQQRGQIWQMFYQRIQQTVASLDSTLQPQSRSLLKQLAAYEQLREPLAALEHYGDLIGEVVEQLPAEKLPLPLLQKYVTLVEQQIGQLLVVVNGNGKSNVLGANLTARLGVFNEAKALSLGRNARDNLTAMQALELRCKNISALVMEGYHQLLAGLLQECLAEEGRRKVRPLRLAEVL